MAVIPEEVPYTRDDVYGWMQEFFQQQDVTDLRQWLTDKLGDDATLEVQTPAHQWRGATTQLIDLLMADTESYVMDFRNAG